MSPSPVTPSAAREQAAKKYLRHFGVWAVAAAQHPDIPGSAPALDLPLHPPTEAQALTQGRNAIEWVASWQDVPGTIWGGRQWASLGRQNVPERLLLDSPGDVAHFCGKDAHWRRASGRIVELLALPDATDGLAQALSRSAVALEALSDVDFGRLLGVLTWLGRNRNSGMYVRQLPIRGVDSKWVGAHRGLVERLHAAATGAASLGLTTAPGTVRLRFLDRGLAPGGLGDVSAPVAELAALAISPRIVFVFENLESVLAMPPMAGAVVVHGSGYAVDRLASIPWLGQSHVIYWGDLDSHGFAILNRFRASGLAVETVLMDVGTLAAHKDLCVPEPKPASGQFSYLRPVELAVMAELAARGNVRLEQERISWDYALAQLFAAQNVYTQH
ncbi:Wadjet anti-phage system protein JetD domain-containing protein [Arthrobacter sp. LAPM80]|uniref:Wadjet anti-phage system protein JetD domain-containing protein n=1 Tax=Arthrobacter sp. LAPM80 TaxID=3141788 RepID=UPI00398ABA48